jgi:hypothetical protein
MLKDMLLQKRNWDLNEKEKNDEPMLEKDGVSVISQQRVKAAL